jgi:hypothetical protein
MKQLALVASLVFLANSARAETPTLTGKEMREWCTSPIGSAQDDFCNLYMAGFVQGAGAATGNSHTGEICLPPNFTGAEGRQVFLRMMRTAGTMNSPDEQVDTVVGAALAAAFPCKNSN